MQDCFSLSPPPLSFSLSLYSLSLSSLSLLSLKPMSSKTPKQLMFPCERKIKSSTITTVALGSVNGLLKEKSSVFRF